MSFTLHINNSFCQFSDSTPKRVLDATKMLLTYQNDIKAEKGMIFKRLKWFKKIKDQEKIKEYQENLRKLEASEWVCWLKGREFPTGHLNMVKDLLDLMKMEYSLKDLRIVPDKQHIIRWNNKPFDMRYYQQEVFDLAVEAHRGVIESGVGTGKTLILAYLLKEWAVNSIIVVTSKGLLEQMYNDLSVWFGTKWVQKIATSDIRNKVKLKPFRIVLINTLASLQKTGDLDYLIQDVHASFWDEFHHSSSSSYLNLMKDTGHIYYKIGTTGTFYRNDNKTLDMWGLLSNCIYSYSAKQAISDGFLVPMEVHIHSLKGKPSSKYKTEYKNNYCDNILFYTEVLKIVKEYSKNEQILILVKRKDQSGALLHKLLNKKGYYNIYISGDDKGKVINEAIKKFNDKEINILIGSSCIGEGINVSSTDHLIHCQGDKSSIDNVQVPGRLVRLHEDKSKGILHDFRFLNTKYMQNHLDQRLQIYIKNFDPVIKEI